MTPQKVIKYNHWLPQLLGVTGITIYPYILVDFEYTDLSTWDHVIAHEHVHVEQIEKIGWWKFYYSYLLEYVKNRFKGLSHNQAYMEISYEKDAYFRQNASFFMGVAYAARQSLKPAPRVV